MSLSESPLGSKVSDSDSECLNVPTLFVPQKQCVTKNNGFLLHQGDPVWDHNFLFLKKKVVQGLSPMSCPCCYGDVCETDLISPSPLKSWRQWYDNLYVDQRFEIYLTIEAFCEESRDEADDRYDSYADTASFSDEVDDHEYDGDVDTESIAESYFGNHSLAKSDSLTATDSFLSSNWDYETASDEDSEPASDQDSIAARAWDSDQDCDWESITASDWDSDDTVGENVYSSPLAAWRLWYDNLSIEGQRTTALFIKHHVDHLIVSVTADPEIAFETEVNNHSDVDKVPYGASDTKGNGSSPHHGSKPSAKQDDEEILMREWYQRVGVEMTKEMSMIEEKDSWLQGGLISPSEGDESDDESQFDDDDGYDDRLSDEGFFKDPYGLATF